jgi:hypothetical protein
MAGNGGACEADRKPAVRSASPLLIVLQRRKVIVHDPPFRKRSTTAPLSREAMDRQGRILNIAIRCWAPVVQ